MQAFSCTDDGIDRTGRQALGTTDAHRLVNHGHGGRRFNADRRINWARGHGQQFRERQRYGGTARWTPVC
jgi:hypothetical protein